MSEKCTGAGGCTCNDNNVNVGRQPQQQQWQQNGQPQQQSQQNRQQQNRQQQNNQQQNGPKQRPQLPKIVGGFLNLTNGCNLACKYCFIVQSPSTMSLQVAKDTADFYVRNALGTTEIPSINYFGGEPLLRWDAVIVPLTLYIREKFGDNFTLGITTNGILLDREKLEFMKEHKIGFLFSIDGDKKTQDLNRPFHNGKGSFDELVEKIPMFLEYNPRLTFRATVDHDNVSEMAANYKFAIKMGYTNVFMIPNVFAEWSEEEKAELEVQCALIADIYMDTVRRGKPVDFNQFGSAKNDIQKLDGLKNDPNFFRSYGVDLPAFGRCGLGGSKFAAVGPEGDIYSCQEMVGNPGMGDKFTIGNIYTGVDDEKRWEVMAGFDPRVVRRSDMKSCIDCEINKICTGSCTINNYFATGDLNIMPAVLCLFYQLMIKEYRRIMEVMSAEGNETFKSIYNNR